MTTWECFIIRIPCMGTDEDPKGQWFAQSDTISPEGEDLHPVEFFVLVLYHQWNRGEVQMR